MKDVLIKDIKRKTNVNRSVLMEAALSAYAKMGKKKLLVSKQKKNNITHSIRSNN
jgi:hypothetical protein